MNGLLGNAAYYMQRSGQQPGGLLPAGPASFQGGGGGRMLSAPSGVQTLPSKYAGLGEGLAALGEGISGAVDTYKANQEAEKQKAQWQSLFTPTQMEGGPTVANAATAPINKMLPNLNPAQIDFLQKVGPEKGMPWIQSQVLKTSEPKDLIPVPDKSRLFNPNTNEVVLPAIAGEDSKPLSTAGKQAWDEGLRPGTPEWAARIRELTAKDPQQSRALSEYEIYQKELKDGLWTPEQGGFQAWKRFNPDKETGKNYVQVQSVGEGGVTVTNFYEKEEFERAVAEERKPRIAFSETAKGASGAESMTKANVMTSLDQLQTYAREVFGEDGTEYNKFAAMNPLSTARQNIDKVVETFLKVRSGAAAPVEEIKKYTDLYTVGIFDDKEKALGKFNALQDFFKRMAESLDPNSSNGGSPEITQSAIATEVERQARNGLTEAETIEAIATHYGLLPDTIWRIYKREK